jgi:hypothetical protein
MRKASADFPLAVGPAIKTGSSFAMVEISKLFSASGKSALRIYNTLGSALIPCAFSDILRPTERHRPRIFDG